MKKKKQSTCIILIGIGIKKLIFFQIYATVHCSKSAKIYKFASTIASLFWYIGGAKIALQFFSSTIINSLKKELSSIMQVTYYLQKEFSCHRLFQQKGQNKTQSTMQVTYSIHKLNHCVTSAFYFNKSKSKERIQGIKNDDS